MCVSMCIYACKYVHICMYVDVHECKILVSLYTLVLVYAIIYEFFFNNNRLWKMDINSLKRGR